jgi:ATP-dependent RNA helicase SUPV3L1/SUV3
MGEAAGDLFTPPRIRALLAALTDNSGMIGRAAVEDQLNALAADERPQLRKLGFTIGSLDIFHPQLLKPEAVRWRAALIAAQQGSPIPALPPHGAVLQKAGSHAGLTIAGFRRCATGWLRIDMAEKLARQAHAARMQASAPPTAPIAGSDDHHDHIPIGEDTHIAAAPPGFVIDPALATSLGLDEETRRGLLGSFGFRSVGEPALQRWRWLGLRKPDKRARRKPPRKGGEAAPRAAATSDVRRLPVHQAKVQRRSPDKPRADPPRPDRPARRSPSPNSPFAGLAALLADARKD